MTLLNIRQLGRYNVYVTSYSLGFVSYAAAERWGGKQIWKIDSGEGEVEVVEQDWTSTIGVLLVGKAMKVWSMLSENVIVIRFVGVLVPVDICSVCLTSDWENISPTEHNRE